MLCAFEWYASAFKCKLIRIVKLSPLFHVAVRHNVIPRNATEMFNFHLSFLISRCIMEQTDHRICMCYYLILLKLTKWLIARFAYIRVNYSVQKKEVAVQANLEFDWKRKSIFEILQRKGCFLCSSHSFLPTS